MKKTHTLLLLLTALFVAWSPRLLAQEDTETAEVDRILSDLDAADAPTDDTSAMEAAEGAAATDETNLPAVSLEEAESVEGLQITGAENINEGLVTISYTEVSLADMVRIFAQTAGANIIIPEGLEQPVSGNLNDVFWRDALEVILEQQGFVLLERQSGIFTITPKDQLEAEPLQSEIIEFQYITAQAAQPAVESLLITSNSSAVALGDTNVLMVKERPAQLLAIKEQVKRIDRPRKQVFIEAKFVELNDTAIETLGINWEVLQGYTVTASGLTREYERTDSRTTQDAQVFTNNRSNSQNTNRTTNQDFLDNDPDPTSDTSVANRLSSSGSSDALVQGRNFTEVDTATGAITTVPAMTQTVTRKAVLTAEEFALTLSALQQLDGTRIVSNPKMLVANGQTASIHVGRNEPNVVAIPQGENATTFAYVLDGFIEIGVKLEVTPTISTDKNITVNIIPELSRLLGEKIVGEAGTSFPITQIRRINTEFAVASGMTVAIGGLTQGEEREVVRKVPLLGDLPVVGKYLFTHTRTEEIQDEIIIFVSVKAINTTDELNDRDGIPEEGKLIHTWLDIRQEEAAEAEKAEEMETVDESGDTLGTMAAE